MGKLQDTMKQFLAIALCFLAVGVFSQTDLPVCTEADNADSFATCAIFRTYCATTIAACNGESSCLGLVGTVFDSYLAAQQSVLSAVSDFTCDENFTDSTANNSAANLSASMVIAFVAKLLL